MTFTQKLLFDIMASVSIRSEVDITQPSEGCNMGSNPVGCVDSTKKERDVFPVLFLLILHYRFPQHEHAGYLCNLRGLFSEILVFYFLYHQLGAGLSHILERKLAG